MTLTKEKIAELRAYTKKVSFLDEEDSADVTELISDLLDEIERLQGAACMPSDSALKDPTRICPGCRSYDGEHLPDDPRFKCYFEGE